MATTGAAEISPNPAGDLSLCASDPLVGRRILIVEDDPYIALALEETLAEAGLIIAGQARSVDEALARLRDADIQIALLDLNLGAERVDAVADALSALGRPFVFTSGYGRSGLPETYADRPMVEKPFYVEELLRALRAEAVARA